MGKNQIKINENQLKNIINESVRRILKENFNSNEFFDDLNNMIDNPMEYFKDNDAYKTQYPEDVYDWGEKVQQLGLELSRLCGKYRFDNGEVYDNLKKIESEYNSVCGDLNTFGIASHWDS